MNRLLEFITDASGKLSISRLANLTAIIFSSWLLAYVVIRGDDWETAFQLYMLIWSGNYLFSKQIDKPPKE